MCAAQSEGGFRGVDGQGQRPDTAGHWARDDKHQGVFSKIEEGGSVVQNEVILEPRRPSKNRGMDR